MNDERIERQFQVSGAPRIRIENVNGTVTVRPGPDGEVSVTAVRRSGSHSRTEIEISQDSDGAVIARARVNKNKFFFLDFSLDPDKIDFTLNVPAKSDVTARVVNSSIDLHGITGSLDLKTVNGPVTANDLSGEISIHTVNGTISGSRLSGPADLKTVNGKILLSESNLPVLSASTVNGRLALETPIGSGPYHLHTVNGSVELASGAAPSGRVHFSTVAGKLKVDGKTVRSGKDREHHGPHSRTVDLGAGGPDIYFKSVSGNLSFLTGAPGEAGESDAAAASSEFEASPEPPPAMMDILERISRGELSVDEGLAEMHK